MAETVSEAIEADAFLQIYEAIENSSRKIQVPVRHLCAVRKVVWSSFDYMTGPELGFTWEAVTAASEATSSGKSSLSDSSRDDSSLTSSVTKGGGSAADYEEIDDVYRSKLLTEAISDMQECTMCTDISRDLFCHRCDQASELPYDAFKMNMLVCSDERLYLDEFMTESHSTIDGTTTITASDSDHMKHLTSLTSTSRNDDLESSTNSDKDGSVHKAEEVTGMSSLNEGDLLVLDETSAKNSEDLQGMVSSGVDSGIVGTVSMYSELSTMASSHAKEMLNVKLNEEVTEASYIVNHDRTETGNNVTKNYVDKEQGAQYVGQADYETLCDLVGGSSTVQLSDEEYVAKFVLAEQICSTPMPSNPVIHKLTLLPKRRLFVGSYLFQVNHGARHDRAMCAISLLGDYSKWEWYAERQNIIEEAFIDIIPRLRISYLTENIEDFICRATKEISKLMSFIGVCEAYPLLPQSTHDIRLQFRQTYFGSGKLQNNSFLAKAITAVLLSQSHCVIVGDKKADVIKMLLTLCLFVAPEWRWLCIKPFQHPYSPYLRLQAIQRIELITIMYAGTESHWPLTVIDLDRRIVCTSSPYPKHRTLKLLKQRNDITQILKGTGVDFKDSIIPKIELRNCHADPRVTNFLIRMDLLPFERSARLGFIRQFRLMVENSARALIAYVQDISEPDYSYKQHTTSSKWSLWPARKSLDLVSNASFLVTLSEAERILPEIADFICESNKL